MGTGVGTGKHTTFVDTAPGMTGTGTMGTGTGTMGTGPGHTGTDHSELGTAAASGTGAALGLGLGKHNHDRRGSRFGNFGRRGTPGAGTGSVDAGTDVTGSRRSSVPFDFGARRGSAVVRRASMGDPTLFHAHSHESGWRGLFANRRSLAVALFASLGGLLYGYNQGVFGEPAWKRKADGEARYRSCRTSTTATSLL